MVDIKKINEHIQGIYEAINKICANIPEKGIYCQKIYQPGIERALFEPVDIKRVYSRLRDIKINLASIEALLKS